MRANSVRSTAVLADETGKAEDVVPVAVCLAERVASVSLRRRQVLAVTQSVPGVSGGAASIPRRDPLSRVTSVHLPNPCEGGN